MVASTGGISVLCLPGRMRRAQACGVCVCVCVCVRVCVCGQNHASKGSIYHSLSIRAPAGPQHFNTQDTQEADSPQCVCA
jgi:hypothetical protein